MKPQIFILFLTLFVSCKNQDSEITYTSFNFEVIELTRGVYACIHKPGGKAICNIGIVDNGDETIIFDNFLSPEAASEIPSIVAHYNLSPIKYVINSHYHNDHIRGNQVFSDSIKIISTTRTAQLIGEKEPLEIADEKEYAPARLAYYDSLFQVFKGDQSGTEFQKIMMWKAYYNILTNSHKEINTRVPDRIVDEETYLNGKDRRVKLVSRGKGHTESDMILFLPDDGILFTGDLVFNQCHPYVAHGFLNEWTSWLVYLLQLNPSIVIPGHGSPGDTATIQSMKNYITDIEKLATKINDPGQISVDLIPSKYSDWWFDRFFPVNLTFAYQQQSKNLDEHFNRFLEELQSGADGNKLAHSEEYYQLISDPEFRLKVRETIKSYSNNNTTTMVPDHEPGERINVTCTILDAENEIPLEGVSVELVHTDIHGLYFYENSLWNPKIFAYLISDPFGQVQVNTIMPGRYSGDENEVGPAHIHFTLEKEGYQTYAAEFTFGNDPVFQKSGNPENLPVAKIISDANYEVTLRMHRDGHQEE